MDDALRDRVRELTDADAAPDLALADGPLGESVALAWALKEEAIASWTAEPVRTQRCASLTAALARSSGSQEIAGAAAWCAGMDHLTRGEMERALERFDTAREALLAIGQAHRAAQSQIPRLIALSMLGRHDDAVASAELTRAQLMACGDELGTGKVELNLGSMLLRQDRYEAAAGCYRQAAARFARAGDARHSIMADIGLAGALSWQYEFDEASRLYERASMRVRSRGLHDLQGVIDTNRGRLELHRGRFDAALRSLEAALQEAEQHGMPQDVAEARRDMADAYLALNLLPEAVALYDQTIESCRELYAPVERAWAELQRSQALARGGDPALAAQGLDTARELFHTHANPVGLALADLRLATQRLRLGDAAAALRLAETAATAFADAGVEGWRGEADLLAAQALAAQGLAVDAQHRCERTLDAAQDLPELATGCLTTLGRLMRQRGHADAARSRFEQAAQRIEAQRAVLPGDEFRVAYGADKQAPFDALLELALDDPATDGPERLLATMERARAQALGSALARPDGAGGIDAQRREQLHWLQGQWQDAIAQGADERAAALHGRMRALEHGWLEQQRRAQVALGHRRPAEDPGHFELERLCDRLPAGTALVEYALLGERLAIVVVAGGSVHRFAAPAAGLVERIAQLRFQIDALRFGATALARHAPQMALRVRAHLQALHALVWQPLATRVADCEQVIVVPHRELHYVPFCALHDGQRSLIDQHELTLAPSAALWSAPRDRRGPGGTTALRRVAALGLGGTALPHVATELRAVASAFEAMPGGAATLRLDGEATLGALHDALAGADVLHLACHGQFRADSPYFSSLQLADGPLTLRDAARLPLQARLVTLSACESGLSRVAPGDELLGLLRGFLLAGAPQVLASQWTVDDASTATLMGAFYRRLLAGERAAASLRAAQRELAAEWPHPFHWAAFALHQRA